MGPGWTMAQVIVVVVAVRQAPARAFGPEAAVAAVEQRAPMVPGQARVTVRSAFLTVSRRETRKMLRFDFELPFFPLFWRFPDCLEAPSRVLAGTA